MCIRDRLYIILTFFLNFLSQIKSFIYDTLISRTLTMKVHQNWIQNSQNSLANISSILDIGVGTGLPLKSILSKLPKDIQIKGIDIDGNYVKKAQQLFQEFNNVKIYEQNFYDIEVKEKYDLIIFTFSFMLMPDQDKAIEIAKKLLKKNGRIIFFLTLHTRESSIITKIKPWIKYLSTIDFGNITIGKKFLQILKDSGLQIIKQERVACWYNPIFLLNNVCIYECQV
eukprot:TRINITY_DN25638_c0_g1_i1.p1 TRINITY_DN25638_c0_g1~~TRINITY_DN25638_c0_g1_i1.p1  ORF type:complete len:227 (+),score=25.95 TRINITY_DN25638_c0_g1_i1:73-753(+)